MTFAWTLISRGVVALMASVLAVPFGPAGCSEQGAKASAGGVDGACPSGEVRSPEGECACPAATVPRVEGGCQPAGLPLDMPCTPGEMPLEGGGCEPAGVGPEACGEGFEPDGTRGCNAILPAGDCPEGLMAIPGETKCHEVSPCGSGTWGDIPVEANTVFVDGSYSGGGSNGTKEKPWTTIQAGVKSAEEGAIVAVAAGSYKESVQISSKPVRLWGRCPSMVEVEGTSGKQYAILVFDSNGAGVRGLALRGPGIGLWTTGSTDVIADRVWVHHTGDQGVRIDNTYGLANLTVSSSLIEAIAGVSVVAVGSSLMLSRSVVRDTVSTNEAAGVAAAEGGGERASVAIHGSVISRTHRFGVGLFSSSIEIDATLIRDIQLIADGTAGQGVFAFLDGKGGATGDLTIRSSLIERVHSVGVEAFGPGLTIESTVIRNTLPDKHGDLGRGINLAQLDEQAERGGMTIRGSLVEGNREVGVGVYGSDALIEGTIVRGTRQKAGSTLGVGVSLEYIKDKGGRTNATVRSSVIQGNVSAGILVAGSDAAIEASLIADTKHTQEGIHGTGIAIQRFPKTLEPSSALVRSCLIERNVETGVTVVSSDAMIETSHVRDIQPTILGTFGDGVMVFSLESPATTKLYGTLVESSARAGITSFGANIVLDRIAVTCGALDINGEAHNGTDFVFDDRGGTACGCPAAADRCHVQSSGLQPPPPIEGF